VIMNLILGIGVIFIGGVFAVKIASILVVIYNLFHKKEPNGNEIYQQKAYDRLMAEQK